MSEKQLIEQHKSKLIMKILKELSVEDLSIPAVNKENINNFIKYLKVKDYIMLDKENTVLGIPKQDLMEPVLTYTERQKLKEYIEKTLKTVYEPLIQYHRENEEQEYDKKSNEQKQKCFLEKENLIIENTKKLLNLKQQKLELMQKIAEIRTGPDQRDTVEMLHQEAQLGQLKAEMVAQVLLHQIATGTKHSVQAIKTVESFIDTNVEQQKE